MQIAHHKMVERVMWFYLSRYSLFDVSVYKFKGCSAL